MKFGDDHIGRSKAMGEMEEFNQDLSNEKVNEDICVYDVERR
jgi:hypothetical protein